MKKPLTAEETKALLKAKQTVHKEAENKDNVVKEKSRRFMG